MLYDDGMDKASGLSVDFRIAARRSIIPTDCLENRGSLFCISMYISTRLNSEGRDRVKSQMILSYRSLYRSPTESIDKELELDL